MTPADVAELICSALDNESGPADEGYFSVGGFDGRLHATYYDEDGGEVATFYIEVVHA